MSFSQPTALVHLHGIHSEIRKNTFEWRLIPRPVLFRKNAQCHRCSSYDTKNVKVERDIWRRSPVIAGWHQQRNDFCNVHHREHLPVLYGPFRYHLAKHIILCQVQVICHFRFVHRRLRPKTVQLKKRRHPPITLQWSHPHSHLYTCALPQPLMYLPAHIRSLAFHCLLHQPARTLSGINTPHISSPVILHPPVYEDGTDRGFRNVGY